MLPNDKPVSQFVPVYPATHAHVYVSMPSVQVPPFWHGFDAQSSMSVVGWVGWGISSHHQHRWHHSGGMGRRQTHNSLNYMPGPSTTVMILQGQVLTNQQLHDPQCPTNTNLFHNLFRCIPVHMHTCMHRRHRYKCHHSGTDMTHNCQCLWKGCIGWVGGLALLVQAWLFGWHGSFVGTSHIC